VAIRSFDELLSFHGLTVEDATRLNIRSVYEIRDYWPDLYRRLVYDDPRIEDRIVEWHIAFSTNVTTDYAVRRGWTLWHALREVVQNSLDEEEAIYGYENIRVDVWGDLQGTHVRDRGKGITVHAFIVGGTEKRPWERGFFGEGLKVAAAIIASEGGMLYAFTRGYRVYKTVNIDGLIWVVGGKSTADVSGTEMVVVGPYINPAVVDTMVFQAFMSKYNPQVISKVELGHPTEVEWPKKPSIIVDYSTADGGVLWVRDIYVNTFKGTSGKPSVFSYNLWWINLEPNRVMANPDDLSREVVRVYTPSAIRELLSRVVENGVVKGGLYETEVAAWRYVSSEVVEEVAKMFSDYCAMPMYEAEKKDWLQYITGKPIVVYTPAMRKLFEKVPDAELAASEKLRELSETAVKGEVPLSCLTIPEANNVAIAALLVTNVRGIKGVKVAKLPIDTAGTTRDGFVVLNKDYIYGRDGCICTALHEAAHIYGRQKYGAAPDVSREFEEALGEVADEVIHFLFEAMLSDFKRETVIRYIRGFCTRMEPSFRRIDVMLRHMFEKLGISELEVYSYYFGRDVLGSLRDYGHLIFAEGDHPGRPYLGHRTLGGIITTTDLETVRNTEQDFDEFWMSVCRERANEDYENYLEGCKAYKYYVAVGFYYNPVADEFKPFRVDKSKDYQMLFRS